MFTSGQTDSYVDCSSPPDWRWRKACKTHSRGRPHRKRPNDPEWLRPLLGLADLASGPRHRGRQIPVGPELMQAFQYFQSGGPPG
jgi:hypothetical protein